MRVEEIARRAGVGTGNSFDVAEALGVVRTFDRSLVPRYTALLPRPRHYLRYYDFERGHTGRHNHGCPPAELVYGARKVHPR